MEALWNLEVKIAPRTKKEMQMNGTHLREMTLLETLCFTIVESLRGERERWQIYRERRRQEISRRQSKNISKL